MSLHYLGKHEPRKLCFFSQWGAVSSHWCRILWWFYLTTCWFNCLQLVNKRSKVAGSVFHRQQWIYQHEDIGRTWWVEAGCSRWHHWWQHWTAAAGLYRYDSHMWPSLLQQFADFIWILLETCVCQWLCAGLLLTVVASHGALRHIVPQLPTVNFSAHFRAPHGL